MIKHNLLLDKNSNGLCFFFFKPTKKCQKQKTILDAADRGRF